MNVEPGDRKTTSLTIDEPGRYTAECTVESHAEAGMTIDVVVADSMTSARLREPAPSNTALHHSCTRAPLRP